MSQLIDYQKFVLVIGLLIQLSFTSILLAQSVEDQFIAIQELLAEEQFVEAIEQLKTVTTTIDKTKKPLLWTKVQTELGIAYQKQADYTTAAEVLQNAADWSEQQADSDSLTALLWHKIGVNYYYQNDNQRAVEFYQKALDLRQQFLSPIHIDIVKGQRNIGTAWVESKQYEHARTALEQSVDLHLQRSEVDSALLGDTYRDLGFTYLNLKDVTQTERYLLAALDYLKQLYAENELWELGNIYTDLSSFYFAYQQPQAALKYTEEAIEIYVAIPDKYPNDYHYLADFYNQKGAALFAHTKYAQAVIFFQKSLINNQLYPTGRTVEIIRNYNNIALCQLRLEQSKRAAETIKKALNIHKKLNDDYELARTLQTEAEILTAQKEYAKSLNASQTALQLLIPNFAALSNYDLPPTKQIIDKILVAQILVEKANTLRQLQNINQAEELSILQYTAATYDTIQVLLQQIRLNVAADESKTFLVNEAKNIYQAAIAVQYDLYQKNGRIQYLERVFDLIEQSKSVILLDAVHENTARNFANIPSNIRQRENQLNNEIQQIKIQIQVDTTHNTDFNNQLIIKELSLKKLIDSLEKTYPDYYNLKYQNQTSSLTDLSLDTNRTVLQYFIGSEYLYLLAINENKSQLIRTELDFSLPDLVERLQAGLLNYHLSGKRSEALYAATADTLVNAAHQLHQRLITPLLTANFQLKSKLLIIPDGVLGYVPFEILLSKLPKRPTAFGSHHYFIKNHQISYTYSATLLHQMQRQSQRGKHHFLAFAPTFPTKDTALADRGAATRSSLNPLIYNTDEVKALQDLLGGDIYEAATATKANFLKQANNYRILHLATHGKADDVSGNNAYLAFFPQSELKDFLLTNQELYLLDLQADMVVLSACETGIGELQNGEGIISLARGFSYAGAKSIVPTLWSINDQMTIELMTSFYKNLQGGQKKDAALHQAKLAYLTAHPNEEVHPFFWAAFIVIGDTQPLDVNEPFSLWKTIALILITLLAVFAIFIKKKDDFNKKSPFF